MDGRKRKNGSGHIHPIFRLCIYSIAS
jgi:hypothetical protein